MSFAQLQQTLAQALIASGQAIQRNIAQASTSERSSPTGEIAMADTLDSQLTALINSMPYYGDPSMTSVHRGALANLLEINLPNEQIAPHPFKAGFGYMTSYSYRGSYSGYRDAFFHGIGGTAVSTKVAQRVSAVNSGINGAWWGNYGVGVLTDAIARQVSVSLDHNALTSYLNTMHSTLIPAITASYLAVFELGYSPTFNAIQAINHSNQMAQAASLLDQWISGGRFTTNINQALDVGGDSSIAATWFLYNLWVTLTALGSTTVDSEISNYIAKGLKVPTEVDASHWWEGSFLSWYIPLSGADVMPQASATIGATMPESSTTGFTTYPPTIPTTINVDTKDGYSLSFTQWGKLAKFKPAPASCFGGNTLVLMADGSSKAIRDIKEGDMVMTSEEGGRKVVLLEKPKRAGRPLFGINNLSLQVTGGHPLLTADDTAKYTAQNPWDLIDGIPTITKYGVSALEINQHLKAFTKGSSDTLRIESINTYEADDSNEDENVYDIILESWEKDHPCYYVGGPEVFIATEGETIDPLHDIFVSTTIITAMEMTLSLCRDHLSDAYAEIPTLVREADMARVEKLAKEAARVYREGRAMPRISIPKPDFYKHNGEWDEMASLLEYYLARQHGRTLMSAIYNGWHTGHQCSSHPAGDHLVVCVHDIELLGEPAPADLPLRLELSHDGHFILGSSSFSHELQTLQEPSWNIRVDDIIDMGRLLSYQDTEYLNGRLKVGEHFSRSFRVHLSKDKVACHKGNHYLHDSQGHITGRLSLSAMRQSVTEIEIQKKARATYSEKAKMAYAYTLGRQLGYELMARIEASSSARQVNS